MIGRSKDTDLPPFPCKYAARGNLEIVIWSEDLEAWGQVRRLFKLSKLVKMVARKRGMAGTMEKVKLGIDSVGYDDWLDVERS